MADHWKKQGPWPHYLGDSGLSKCSPAPGPAKAGTIRHVAFPIPLTGLIVRPDGTLFGTGFEELPEQTPGEYAEQKKRSPRNHDYTALVTDCARQTCPYFL